MPRKKKLTDVDILHEIYRRVYKASTPSADWDELLASATLNEHGQKDIKFMEYECSKETMEEILINTLKEHKVPTWRRPAFVASFWLGCSPKTAR
jgi:hypothetical protein